MNNQLVIFNKETEERQMFTTCDLNKAENKAKIFNATENADVLANDCVGEELMLRDVYMEKIPYVDDETGEAKTKYRTILFDETGKTFATGSFGIYNTVTKILNIYGIDFLHETGLKVEIAKGSIGNGKSKLYLKVK